MILGYVRVSTGSQNTDVQKNTLNSYAQKENKEIKIYDDAAWSGTIRHRPKLDMLINDAKSGDILVVCKLDRLARSTQDLFEILKKLSEKGVGFYSIGEPMINTTTPSGKLVLTILAGVSEFERDLIVGRMREGRKYAKEIKHVKFGRPLGKTNDGRVIDNNDVIKMYQSGLSEREICRRINCSRSLVRKMLVGIHRSVS